MNRKSGIFDCNKREIIDGDVVLVDGGRDSGRHYYVRYYEQYNCWAIVYQYGDTTKESSLRYSLVVEPIVKLDFVIEPLPNRKDNKCLCYGTWMGGDGVAYMSIEVIGRIPDNNDMRTFNRIVA